MAASQSSLSPTRTTAAGGRSSKAGLVPRQHPLVVRGQRADHAEPAAGGHVAADLLDLLIAQGHAAGKHQAPDSGSDRQLVIVEDLKAPPVLDQQVLDARREPCGLRLAEDQRRKTAEHGDVGHDPGIAQQVAAGVVETDVGLQARATSAPSSPGMLTILPYSNQQMRPRQSRLKAIDSAISSGVSV